MAFDFVKDRLVIDYNTYQNICKANKERINKRRNKNTDGIQPYPTDTNSNSKYNNIYIIENNTSIKNILNDSEMERVRGLDLLQNFVDYWSETDKK
jgi:hypothetical protein